MSVSSEEEFLSAEPRQLQPYCDEPLAAAVVDAATGTGLSTTAPDSDDSGGDDSQYVIITDVDEITEAD